jgi:hypothetical protein
VAAWRCSKARLVSSTNLLPRFEPMRGCFAPSAGHNNHLPEGCFTTNSQKRPCARRSSSSESMDRCRRALNWTRFTHLVVILGLAGLRFSIAFGPRQAEVYCEFSSNLLTVPSSLYSLADCQATAVSEWRWLNRNRLWLESWNDGPLSFTSCWLPHPHVSHLNPRYQYTEKGARRMRGGGHMKTSHLHTRFLELTGMGFF